MNGAKPPRGGEFLALYLINNLNRKLFNVTLVYAHEGTIVREIDKGRISTIHLPLSDRMTCTYLRKINMYSPVFVLSFIFNLIKSNAVFKLKRLIIARNIHIVYCADNLSKFIGGLAAKLAGVKAVAHCHDDFKEDILGRSIRTFYLLLLDRILAVSERVRRFFSVRGKLSDKVVTIYNGIDTNVFDPGNVDSGVRAELGIKKDTIVIGSVSVLEKDKGQRYLIEAISKMVSEGIDNVVCVVCGYGPEEDNLKKLVIASGLQERVLFPGFRKDINRIFKILDIAVLTSLTIESFSLVAVESMAMRVPVIGTNVGALPEVVDNGKTGILIPPGNVDALCGAIKYLIENPEIRYKMGKEGRQRVLERFTVEKNVRETEDIFLRLLRGQR